MKSVASTPLRFIAMVIATNAVLIAVVISGAALLAEKHARRIAVRFDTLLSTARFEDAAHHIHKAGTLGLIFAAITVGGIVLCLRAPRIASLVFLGAAIAGVLLTPFTTALPAFFLLNAAAFVFFGRREIPAKLVKDKPEPAAEAKTEAAPATEAATVVTPAPPPEPEASV